MLGKFIHSLTSTSRQLIPWISTNRTIFKTLHIANAQSICVWHIAHYCSCTQRIKILEKSFYIIKIVIQTEALRKIIIVEVRITIVLSFERRLIHRHRTKKQQISRHIFIYPLFQYCFTLYFFSRCCVLSWEISRLPFCFCATMAASTMMVVVVYCPLKSPTIDCRVLCLFCERRAQQHTIMFVLPDYYYYYYCSVMKYQKLFNGHRPKFYFSCFPFVAKVHHFKQ